MGSLDGCGRALTILYATARYIIEVLARHPLTFYFIIAYAGTWLITVPVALSANGVGLLPFGIPNGSVIFVSAVWVVLGPTLAAFIMTGLTEGRAGIRCLLRRYVLWRVGLRWYLIVLLGPPVIVLLVTIVLPGALASFQTLAPLNPLLLLVSFPLILIFGGALFEEGGWRGFALPRLERLHGPLVGTLILGILWACWHLPLFWITVWGTPPTVLNMVLFLATVIFMTIVFTWVFNNTKGSILLAILLHTSFDVLVDPVGLLFPAPLVTDYGGALPMLIGLGVTALVLVVLTRGRLGYQNYRQEEEYPDPATAPT
jgi:membrane protease YdiL (CAAX protease family)